MKFKKLIILSLFILLASCRNDNSDTISNDLQKEPDLHLKKITSSLKEYSVGSTSELKYDNNNKIIQIINNSLRADIIYDAQNRIVQINSYNIDDPSVINSARKYEYIDNKIIIWLLYSGVYRKQMTLFLNNFGLPTKCEHNVGDQIIESYFEYDSNMNLIHHYYNNGYADLYYTYDDKKNPYHLFPLVLNMLFNEFSVIGKNNAKSVKYFDEVTNQFKTENNLLEYNSNGYLRRYENSQAVIYYYY